MVEFFPKQNDKLVSCKSALKDCKVSKYIIPTGKTMALLKKCSPGELLAVHDSRRYFTSMFRISINKPSRTITKNGGSNYPPCFHYIENRSLSINEIKRLCTFPDDYIFVGKFRQIIERLGNAVMPKFMEKIAYHIRSSFMENKRPTVISTFAGTGGSSLGYKWAGYNELLAIDFDEHAVECFKLNFTEIPIWKRDISDVTVKEILEFCEIKKGELDVLDGSPPCQGFSQAGKRKVMDSRNDLSQEYIRLIEGLEPKVFVMENVKGLSQGIMKGRFIEIMKALKSLNYEVKCKLMDAKYYGVPQSRKRLIFIGVRKDIYKRALKKSN